MCFSAPASFIASGGLATAGVASLHVAPKNKKLLAAIPLIFAVQQALEGMQWIAINQGATNIAAAYSFLFFAFLFWPTYIPAVAYLLEEKRKRLLWFVLIAGGMITAFLLCELLTQPLSIFAVNHSIFYDISVPLSGIVSVLYVAVVCGSLIASSRKFLRFLGLVMFVTAAAATIFFYTTFTSTWCFFSAVLSAFIYFYCRYDWLNAKGVAK